MKTLILMLTILLSATLFESCYYDKADLLYPGGKVPCDTTVVAKFSTDVKPVMNTSCNLSGCHNTVDAASGVILDTYNGVKTQADNGRLLGSVDPINGSMPKNAAKLSSCSLAKIQQWINSGTPNN